MYLVKILEYRDEVAYSAGDEQFGTIEDAESFRARFNSSNTEPLPTIYQEAQEPEEI